MGVTDYALESTLDFKFTSRSFTTGIPTTLAGTPAVQVYEDNDVVQITAGITLTVDFDSVTGLNNLRIAATAANGFEAGKSYHAVLSAGTVGGVSVVGEVVAQFSIERTAAVRPTVAGRTLDVSVTGEAGVDWANVGSPTTTVNLSGTNFNTAQVVASVTGAVGSVTGNIGGSVASVSGAVGSVAGNVDGNVTGSVGSLVGHTVQTGDSFARIGAAGVGLSDVSLSTAGNNAAADALLKRDWTGLTGEAARSVLNALRFLRNKWSISGTTVTITKEDDATTAWTSTVTTSALADPITSNDPD